MTTKVLLCALADSPKTIAGSSFDQTCSICHRRVMISPSGQRRLKTTEGIIIVCTECAKTTPHNPVGFQIAASGEEELQREFEKVIPNPWRERN